MTTYDDYRPSSELNWTADGKTITRVVYIRAADEVEASQSASCPQRGDALDIAAGSASTEYLYCTNVTVSQIEAAAGDAAADFLFEVTAVYDPLQGRNPTPVAGKATWKVTFRPQQITLTNVEQDSEQTHYAPGGSGAETWWPITTGINETMEGPAGVQIDEMVEVLQVDLWKDPDDVEAYLASVRGIVNKTNAAAFEGPWGSYAAGEAKITGLEVSQQSADIVTVSVEVSRSENRTGIIIGLDQLGGTTVSVDKDGWEYLWLRWVKSVDPDDPDEEPKPRRIDAHVAKVYKSGDFDDLGITDDIFV